MYRTHIYNDMSEKFKTNTEKKKGTTIINRHFHCQLNLYEKRWYNRPRCASNNVYRTENKQLTKTLLTLWFVETVTIATDKSYDSVCFLSELRHVPVIVDVKFKTVVLKHFYISPIFFFFGRRDAKPSINFFFTFDLRATCDHWEHTKSLQQCYVPYFLQPTWLPHKKHKHTQIHTLHQQVDRKT